MSDVVLTDDEREEVKDMIIDLAYYLREAAKLELTHGLVYSLQVDFERCAERIENLLEYAEIRADGDLINDGEFNRVLFNRTREKWEYVGSVTASGCVAPLYWHTQEHRYRIGHGVGTGVGWMEWNYFTSLDWVVRWYQKDVEDWIRSREDVEV